MFSKYMLKFKFKIDYDQVYTINLDLLRKENVDTALI